MKNEYIGSVLGALAILFCIFMLCVFGGIENYKSNPFMKGTPAYDNRQAEIGIENSTTEAEKRYWQEKRDSARKEIDFYHEANQISEAVRKSEVKSVHEPKPNELWGRDISESQKQSIEAQQLEQYKLLEQLMAPPRS